MYKVIERSIPSIYLKLKAAELGTVDIASMLYLIQQEEIENNCIIVNSLNILLDLLSCTKSYFTKAIKKNYLTVPTI